MPTRKDILGLQDRLKQAMKTLADMKSAPQPMAGDSWIYYRRMIYPDWDYEVHGITNPSYNKLYKVTYNVERPNTGFALAFVEADWDTPTQDMSYNWSPVKGDPYSWWLKIKHVEYNSNAAGILVRFNIFSPQTGTISVTEIV